MGNCTSCNRGGVIGSSWRAPNREATLLLLGLDNAGKSTILANLNKEDTDEITPTIGFANASLTFARHHVTMYDVGGGPRIRGIWKNYYAEAHGIIFVVDASSEERLDEARQVLAGVLQDERMVGKPLLIFANKQDQAGALGDTEISNRLELDAVLGEHRATASVVQCTALCSGGDGERDPALLRGVEWLLGKVREKWEEVEERVRGDVERQRAQQERERNERRERVRKIREERERLAALQRAENGEEEEEVEEEDVGANPFKPIAQVLAEATEREARAKAAQKQAGEKSREDSEHTLPPHTTVPATPPTTVPATPPTTVPATPPTTVPVMSPTTAIGEQSRLVEGASGSSPWRRAGSLQSEGRSEGSRPVSGLSESSDSLTEVTVPSKDGSLLSESLGPSTAPTPLQPVAMATTQPQAVRVRPRGHISSGEKEKEDKEVVEEAGESGLKKHKPSFLSRLKSRSKVTPSSHSLSATTTGVFPPPPLHPPPSMNTWVAPSSSEQQTEDTETGRGGSRHAVEGEAEEEERRKGRGLGSREGESVQDPLQGLPELPRNRHILPPVRVSKCPPGMEERVFTTAEDITVPQSSLVMIPHPPSGPEPVTA